MRCVRYSEFAGPDALQIEEVPTPTPEGSQVLIEAEAIGPNFADAKVLDGPESGPFFQRSAPGNLIGDVVGRIVAAGPDVSNDMIGQRVASVVIKDAVADYSVIDAGWVTVIPPDLDAAAATMVPMAGPMAIGALRTGRLAYGETVLVNSAAGSVGHMALQLAKVLGAGKVIAAAHSAAKRDFLLEYGADAVVDYSDESWPEQVREVAGSGVDVVLDAVGGSVMLKSFELLAPLGRMVVYGSASGELTSIPPFFGLKSVSGFSLLPWKMTQPEQASKDLSEVIEYLASGQVRTAVYADLLLTEVAEAYRLLGDRARAGRVILRPAASEV